MPRAVRFSRDTEERLKRATKRRGVTTSEYIRSAVEERLDRDDPPRSSWDVLKELSGKFDLGDPELSQRDPGDFIRAKYLAKHGRRAR